MSYQIDLIYQRRNKSTMFYYDFCTNIHSQYEFKLPYNTMQAIRLLQHNNPPQNQLQTSQV